MAKIMIMSIFAGLLALVASSQNQPLYQGPYAAARSYGGAEGSLFDNVNKGDGSYQFSYDTPEGTSVHESGSARAIGSEGPAVTSQGGFSYHAPDGQLISLTYTADENGFHPVGSHLPTPPPIPEAILRSLQLIGHGAVPSHSSEGAYPDSTDDDDSVSVYSSGYTRRH